MKRKVENIVDKNIATARAARRTERDVPLVLPHRAPDAAALCSMVQEWLVPRLVDEFFRRRESQAAPKKPTTDLPSEGS